MAKSGNAPKIRKDLDMKREILIPKGFPVPKGHTARVNKILRSWKC